ncbi:SigE family RNA polymerase sigma factor [Jatrophihabitans telluris]|uniref:SigE family RNA polymerase sigma factor n=1 Tax=Jatrophihabitans telluris TaxID=2038343 RepID=A0ABY4QYG2_9ACTN|nr:SigE family RNA polymerase sigma factor [Jatrophihabitans telluris]UQX87909.1 SigE family RNA polymerase sigma factor [Jatrophihabitans telluris]
MSGKAEDERKRLDAADERKRLDAADERKRLDAADERKRLDAAFSAFVHAESDSLLKTAYLLTRNGPDAEELVQDSLVWLYPRWGQVQAAEHRLAYVRKSMVNRFLAGKRRMSATEVHFDDGYQGFVEKAGAQPDETAAVDSQDLLWRELGVLTERQRAAIVLRFFHDLPDSEVAGALDCRVGTVRSLISRALATLRATGSFADDAVGSYYLRNVN